MGSNSYSTVKMIKSDREEREKGKERERQKETEREREEKREWGREELSMICE